MEMESVFCDVRFKFRIIYKHNLGSQCVLAHV